MTAGHPQSDARKLAEQIQAGQLDLRMQAHALGLSESVHHPAGHGGILQHQQRQLVQLREGDALPPSDADSGCPRPSNRGYPGRAHPGTSGAEMGIDKAQVDLALPQQLNRALAGAVDDVQPDSRIARREALEQVQQVIAAQGVARADAQRARPKLLQLGVVFPHRSAAGPPPAPRRVAALAPRR